MMLLIFDNGSSTLSDLTAALDTIRINYQVVKNDVDLELSNFTGLILSGRRFAQDGINHSNIKMIHEAISFSKPILGICYGSEVLALAYGGSLRKLEAKVEGLVQVTIVESNSLTRERKKLNVYESHRFEVSFLPPYFDSLGTSDSGKHEIFGKESMKIYGVQFHPECSGEDGLFIVSNFATICGCRPFSG